MFSGKFKADILHVQVGPVTMILTNFSKIPHTLFSYLVSKCLHLILGTIWENSTGFIKKLKYLSSRNIKLINN